MRRALTTAILAFALTASGADGPEPQGLPCVYGDRPSTTTFEYKDEDGGAAVTLACPDGGAGVGFRVKRDDGVNRHEEEYLGSGDDVTCVKLRNERQEDEAVLASAASSLLEVYLKAGAIVERKKTEVTYRRKLDRLRAEKEDVLLGPSPGTAVKDRVERLRELCRGLRKRAPATAPGELSSDLWN